MSGKQEGQINKSQMCINVLVNGRLPKMTWPGRSRKKSEHSIKTISPVVIDGIKGDGVFSVLCLGVAVVNGAMILMTVGRTKLCKRIFPAKHEFQKFASFPKVMRL